MNDIALDKVFKSSAFQPTHEELKAATRRRHVIHSKQRPSTDSLYMSVPKQATKVLAPMELPELSDSSDDDLPDTSTLIRNLKLKASTKGKEKAVPSRQLTAASESDDNVRSLSYALSASLTFVRCSN